MKTANDGYFKNYNLDDSLDYLRAIALSEESQKEEPKQKEDWIDREAKRIATLKKFIKQVNGK